VAEDGGPARKPSARYAAHAPGFVPAQRTWLLGQSHGIVSATAPPQWRCKSRKLDRPPAPKPSPTVGCLALRETSLRYLTRLWNQAPGIRDGSEGFATGRGTIPSSQVTALQLYVLPRVWSTALRNHNPDFAWDKRGVVLFSPFISNNAVKRLVPRTERADPIFYAGTGRQASIVADHEAVV
jgi:hypothetical protein